MMTMNAVFLDKGSHCEIYLPKIFCTFYILKSLGKSKQESPANAKGTRDSSACMKAHCEQM